MGIRKYDFQLFGRMRIITVGVKMVDIVGRLPKAD